MTTTFKSTNSTFSDNSSFKVFYKHNQSMIEVKLTNNRLRADEVIMQAIEILSDRYMIKLNSNYMHYALFPATRRGEKASDAIEISHQQRIKGTGVNKFYL
jgi:hypothetical protein